MKLLFILSVVAVFSLTAASSVGSRPGKTEPRTILAQANSSNSTLGDELAAAEKQFWEAWKNKQPDQFAGAMADDAVFFGLYGVTDRKDLIAGQQDSVKSCDVKSYALTNLRAISIDADAAILLYDAEQHAVCGGQSVQPFMHGESVYARRDGRWMNLLRSEVPAADHHDAQGH
ncbi:MAG TPA: nuclear transport factor 2 family protein [Candidatus Acidoferrales bacterium]|nr:nuclear transport factor 2 family protein [Candidatus Acidoferrales bacterium]